MKRQWIASVVMVGLMASVAPSVLADKIPPVLVYVVQPSVTEFVDEALQGRIDSTKDARKAFDGRDVFRVVESPEQAVVIVEILGRGREETSDRTVTTTAGDGAVGQALGGAITGSKAKKECVVRVKFSIRGTDYTATVVGTSEMTWKGAVQEAVLQIEDFVKKNRTKLAALPQ